LFFSGCWPNSLAIFERPLVSTGAWFDRLWGAWFPGATKATYCTAADSELLAALAVDQAGFEALKNENENLRQQLSFFSRESFRHVTASIISRSASPIESILVIDRGRDDGLEVGLAVVAADGHLVGKISKVSDKTAVVQSILDRGAKTAVALLGSSRTLGLSQGNGGPLLSLDFIPQDETIALNDLVVTSGLEEAVPPGLVVGIVTGVKKDPAAPFQTATIEPLVDLQKYKSVSVIVVETGL
jgi:rod shape-determining protein MreC